MGTEEIGKKKWGGIATYLDTIKTPAVKDVVHYLEEHGMHLDRQPNEAFAWCEANAESGDHIAEYSLACLFAYGFGVDKDSKLAIQWCKKAALSGHIRAKWFLAILIISEQNCSQKDWKEANEYLTEASRHGDLEARYSVALLAFNGIGRNVDKEFAISEFEELSYAGHSGAKCALASELIQDGSAESEERAVRLITDAANQENPTAYYMLANFYLTGAYGFPKNEEKSDFYMSKITNS